mgnify:CR=1 FL=1
MIIANESDRNIYHKYLQVIHKSLNLLDKQDLHRAQLSNNLKQTIIYGDTFLKSINLLNDFKYFIELIDNHAELFD